MTGHENIYNNAAVIGFSKDAIDANLENIIAFSELEEFIDMPVKNYSSGMKVRLGFAIAAQMEPDILIIDEVLAVGDLGFRVKCMNRINEMLKNTAVIFVSHAMSQVTTICNKAMLMEHGKNDFYGNDVGLAVEKYFTKFDTTGEQTIGDGSVKLKLFNIIENNKIVDDCFIENGDDLKVIFELETDSAIEQLKFRLGIFNIEYKLLAEVDSETVNFKGTVVNGKIVISAIIKSLYLKSGKYSIHLHVSDAISDKKLLRQSNVKDFMVKPTISVGADFLLASEWSSNS